MQLADDELDADRAEELAGELSEDARDKLAALALAGELLAERADSDAQADDLADSIMDAIEQGELPELDDRDLPEPTMTASEQDDEVPESGVRGESDEPAREIGRAAAPRSAAPANDNGRRIFALAAMAAAVAAGLFLWGRSDPGPEVATPRRPPATAAPAPAPMPAPTQVAELEPEPNEAVPTDQPGVEVAAVDFGESSGAVFYVEGAADEPQTTVVWVTDEVGDDE